MEHTSGTMQYETHAQSVLNKVKQKGILRPIDLEGAGIPRVVLSRLTASGQLERVGRGLYRLAESEPSEYESLAIIARKTPQAVFCLLTALQFHQLTSQLPRQIWIAMPRGSHAPQIDYPPLKMIQVSGEDYAQGIEIHECDHVQLKIYSLAKTIADCFKHRNKIGLDVALEALREARAEKRVSIDELWRFAKICRVANVMRPYLEVSE